MNDLSSITALSKTSVRRGGYGEASNWVAPLMALALNLIVPAVIIDAGSCGFAEIVLFVAALGALVAALACGVLGQRPAWQAEHRPLRSTTTILVEFSFYLILFFMMCLIAWRLRAMAGSLPA
jgi:hypothetical protein